MEYIHLGRTGLVVSRIGLGCMSFGTPGWLNWNWVLDEAQAEPFFRRAVEAGVNFFDTADSYSDGRSEEITGKWLAKYARRDEVVIATKVYFGPSDRPNRKGLSRKHIQHACEASLRRLGVEAIDLYQVHRFDPHTPIDETLSALDDLVQQGKVRYIGASSVYAWEFMRALGMADRRGWARFVAMQNLYNLLYREEERDMAPLCEAEGVSMIPWSPLARGILARAGSPTRAADTERAESDGLLRLFESDANRNVVGEVARVARDRGITPTQVALAWLLSRPAVAAPIVGVSKVSHLDDALAAVDVCLSQDEVAAVERPYRPQPHVGITPPFAMPAPGQVHDRA